MIAKAGILGHGRCAEDHGNRLVAQQLITIAARREARIVGEHGAGADGDCVMCGPLLVYPLPGGGAGDPLTGAVGGRRTTIKSRGPLDGHERSAEAHAREPRPQKLGGLVGEHAADDFDACGAQPVCASPRDGVRVVERVDDAGDPSVDERLRAGGGAPGVVARLKRDDGGEAGADPQRACDA